MTELKRIDGTLIDSSDTLSFVELIIKNKANLQGAYLQGANLRGANLQWANLQGANLRGANLQWANLQGANLRGANLQGANLQGAYLRGADLQWANLQGANLRGADLQWANLQGAYLRGTDLQGAYLQGAKGINPFLTTPLMAMFDQPGAIRAYKLVTANGFGPFNGGILYKVGETYTETHANYNWNEECGAGINLATLGWCLKEWKPTYRVLVAEFTANDIAAIPFGSDGKFRVHRCRIVGEKTLAELGLGDHDAN